MSNTAQKRRSIQAEALSAAKSQVGDVTSFYQLTTQERLDLIATLAAQFAVDQVDRTPGWESRAVSVLSALQNSASEQIQRLIKGAG
ncbi:hypothetical protein [Asaia sp. HumB]|uniref:hypothetical protein n=1 Tax=Asaia sp. HumB TaxID=3035475 RepID=UPI0025548CA8|nr:hypothetical protein [Asaia sp. HumB]MDL2172027.1 hypothetical protein [Asaia sp. HumB]